MTGSYTNFSYYEIDSGDIWYFERDSFSNNNTSEKYANILLEKIQLEIPTKCDPVFSINDSDEKTFQDYYHRNVLQYINASNASDNIKELYAIDFFFDNNSCYQYNYENIIESNNDEFDYWFTLKLRQYQFKILELNHFLNFQLKKSFNNDSDSIKELLMAIINQYGEDMFSNGLIKSINSWVENLKIKKIVPTTRKSSISKMSGKTDSFKLKALTQNKNYLDNRFNKNSTFDKAFNMLKNENFIDSNTNIDNLKNIFLNKQIPPKQRIKWTGSTKELQWFVHILQDESQKIEALKNDIWIVTKKCFINKLTRNKKDKKKGDEEEFTIEGLSKASGNNLDKRELLKQIVENI